MKFSCLCVQGGAGRKRESLLANGQRPVLLHRQLTDDLLVRPPSAMSVTPVKTVDRRLSAELRTQLERTRRTRFSDELKVSLALLVVWNARNSLQRGAQSVTGSAGRLERAARVTHFHDELKVSLALLVVWNALDEELTSATSSKCRWLCWSSSPSSSCPGRRSVSSTPWRRSS